MADAPDGRLTGSRQYADPLIASRFSFVTRRWRTPLLPTVGWTLFYLGVDRGRWGHGIGENANWQGAALVLSGIGLITTEL